MKEAAGEANLTVVAIILIAVVVAVATPLINSLMKTSTWKSCCTDAGGVVNGSKCEYTKPDGTLKSINSSDENAGGLLDDKKCNENFTW